MRRASSAKAFARRAISGRRWPARSHITGLRCWTSQSPHRSSWCRPAVLNALLDLAIEIAREGREGRRIGTLFTVGYADAVLARSRPLILDPLAGHAPQATSVFDGNARGTVKELAQLDGAFVIG